MFPLPANRTVLSLSNGYTRAPLYRFELTKSATFTMNDGGEWSLPSSSPTEEQNTDEPTKKTSPDTSDSNSFLHESEMTRFHPLAETANPLSSHQRPDSRLTPENELNFPPGDSMGAQDYYDRPPAAGQSYGQPQIRPQQPPHHQQSSFGIYPPGDRYQVPFHPSLPTEGQTHPNQHPYPAHYDGPPFFGGPPQEPPPHPGSTYFRNYGGGGYNNSMSFNSLEGYTAKLPPHKDIPVTKFTFSDRKLPLALRQDEKKKPSPAAAEPRVDKNQASHFSFDNVRDSPIDMPRMTPSPIPMPPASYPSHVPTARETTSNPNPPGFHHHPPPVQGPLTNRQNHLQDMQSYPIKPQPKRPPVYPSHHHVYAGPREPPTIQVETAPPGPPNIPDTYPRRLALDLDTEKLNSLHCLIRTELLEVFVVPKGAQTGAMAGRVGLRCVYCAAEREASGRIDPNEAPMAIFYPKAVSEIYRLVTSWQRCHVKKCKSIPKDLKDRWEELRKNDKSRGKTAYWTESAVDLGLIDIASKVGGIRFR